MAHLTVGQHKAFHTPTDRRLSLYQKVSEEEFKKAKILVYKCWNVDCIAIGAISAVINGTAARYAFGGKQRLRLLIWDSRERTICSVARHQFVDLEQYCIAWVLINDHVSHVETAFVSDKAEEDLLAELLALPDDPLHVETEEDRERFDSVHRAMTEESVHQSWCREVAADAKDLRFAMQRHRPVIAKDKLDLSAEFSRYLQSYRKDVLRLVRRVDRDLVETYEDLVMSDRDLELVEAVMLHGVAYPLSDCAESRVGSKLWAKQRIREAAGYYIKLRDQRAAERSQTS